MFAVFSGICFVIWFLHLFVISVLRCHFLHLVLHLFVISVLRCHFFVIWFCILMSCFSHFLVVFSSGAGG